MGRMTQRGALQAQANLQAKNDPAKCMGGNQPPKLSMSSSGSSSCRIKDRLSTPAAKLAARSSFLIERLIASIAL
jgi:hypothetical protein